LSGPTGSGADCLVVGLAGRFCAGKSTIAAWMAGKGAYEIDVDSLGHEARESRRAAIEARFGTADRKELGRIVFADPVALAALEAIVHPAMLEMVTGLVAARRAALSADAAPADPDRPYRHVVLVNAALLFKLGLDRQCDLVIWVDAPYWLRFWRGLRRDGRGFQATWALMRRQRGLSPQPLQGSADIRRVCNLGRLWAFYRVGRILERYHG
jgi:dephospho-CoA kinase